MQNLKLILTFIKAQYKLQSKNKVIFVLSLLTPFTYSCVFVYQILINYNISKTAFLNLPLADYFLCFFSLQMIVFLSFDQSLRSLAKDVLSGEFDYHLMRPISLWFYKYARIPSFLAMIMVILYLIALIITLIVTRTELRVGMGLILFVASSSYTILNIKAMMRGLIFFRRDVLQTTSIEESMNLFVINKPPEIFPLLIQSVLTAVFPFFVVHNNIFNLIRNVSLINIMLWSIFWMVLSTVLNRLVWASGIKRYESG